MNQPKIHEPLRSHLMSCQRQPRRDFQEGLIPALVASNLDVLLGS